VLDLKEHHYERVVVSAAQASRLVEQLAEQSS
jgi:hypothetical protein